MPAGDTCGQEGAIFVAARLMAGAWSLGKATGPPRTAGVFAQVTVRAPMTLVTHY